MFYIIFLKFLFFHYLSLLYMGYKCVVTFLYFSLLLYIDIFIFVYSLNDIFCLLLRLDM